MTATTIVHETALDDTQAAGVHERIVGFETTARKERSDAGGSGSLGLLYATYLLDRNSTDAPEHDFGPPRFATRTTCELAAGLLDEAYGVSDPAPGGVFRRFGVAVSPGALVVRSNLRGDTSDAWCDPDGSDRALREAIYGTDLAPLDSGGGTKSVVTSWSRKSRLNMARTLAKLDWADHLSTAPAGWGPAMVTLTLPADWLAVAPSGESFKATCERFYDRWARAWGQKFAGAWKLEFQGRGAPHLHLYGVVPRGRAFEEWLSLAWMAVVHRIRPRRRDGETWDALCTRMADTYGPSVHDHLVAGTGVDWREGIRASDPRKVALYFLKRSVGHNLGHSKEYQHRVPVEWLGVDPATGERYDLSAGPGRFWGYRGIERIEVTVELDDVQFFRFRRLVRRWAKANGRPMAVTGGSRFQGLTLLHADAPMFVGQAARWAQLSAGGN